MMIGKRERVVQVADFPESAPVITAPTKVESPEPVPVRR